MSASPCSDRSYPADSPSHPILEHVYRARPPSASTILPLYLAHPAPRPSLVYLPSTSPPVTVFSVVHSNLTFIVPSDVDTEPLLVLEFLHRVIDVLEEFVGAPLLSSKIQANYDVIAQLLVEMCDAGIVCNTEPNVLQETVEVPNWMGKLLGGVGLPGLVYLLWHFYCLSGLSEQVSTDIVCVKNRFAVSGYSEHAKTVLILYYGQYGPRACDSVATTGCATHFKRAICGYH